MSLPFIKMQGIGNDFIVLDEQGGDPSRFKGVTAKLAQAICDRRFGVGADQILWIRKPQSGDADSRMEILNADGSAAEMCGNGIRAVGLYLFRHGQRPGRSSYAVETLAGIKKLEIRDPLVKVDMGAPGLGASFRPEFKGEGEPITVLGESFRFHEVSMGNPHAVIFVRDVQAMDVPRLGAALEVHPRFPKKTNVEFVQVLNDGAIQVRVWERGAGITLACGTGACASAVASLATGQVKGTVPVNLPGGTLKISWAGGSAPVMMEGPAEEVFRGEYFG